MARLFRYNPKEEIHHENKQLMVLFGIILSCSTVQAALHVRANGAAQYDDILNVTWLTDANYAATSGYDADGDGQMTWYEAQAWVGAMNNEAHLGVNNWRLSTADPDCPSAINCVNTELGSLYYTTLGNVAFELSNVGPFTNLPMGTSMDYWTGTEPLWNSNSVYRFRFSSGYQSNFEKSLTRYVWPVADGDVASGPAPTFCHTGNTNGDDLVNVLDAVALVSHVLGTGTMSVDPCAGDVNEDDQLNVLDLVALVQMILNPA